MGRALAAEFLISMPTPAEVRVAEKDGNMAMSGMIKTMPHVVRRSTLIGSLYLVGTVSKLVENTIHKRITKNPFLLDVYL